MLPNNLFNRLRNSLQSVDVHVMFFGTARRSQETIQLIRASNQRAGLGLRMAKADHIKKLIASFGRSQEFRAAALRIIDDAANQGKRPFAESLRKISRRQRPS
jgi:hypothetical protein